MSRRRPGRTPGRGAVPSPGSRTAAVFALLAASLLLLLGAPLASSAPQRLADRSPSITITVRSVTPSSPLISTTERPLRVVLAITNLTGQAINDIVITGTRGDPVENRKALATVIGQPAAVHGYPIAAKHPVHVDLPATRAPVQVYFDTTTGIPTDSGICLCHNAVYPLSFTAQHVESDGTTTRLGTAGTYLPAFDRKPSPVRVSWVWPLIDRPHRLTDDRVFIDDDLTDSVAVDGRLDRSLTVLEKVAASVPITIVADPELLDELQVMADGPYYVRSGRHRVAGHGTATALAWLDRLRAILEDHPDITVQTTPLADADVQSLANAGLSWRTSLPSAMAVRVNRALGGRDANTTLTWPAGGAITSRTFGTLAQQGIRQLVLDDASVAPADGANDGVPTGIARLSRHGHRIGAALLDPTIQRDVAEVVTQKHAGLSGLPQLMAQIAVRAAQDPSSSHDVVLAPPRYADVDPTVTARAILDTSRSPFATPAALGDLLASGSLPHRLSRIASLPDDTPTLSSDTMNVAAQATDQLPTVDALLAAPSGKTLTGAAAVLLASLPIALQRSESSFWMYQPTSGSTFAAGLTQQIGSIIDGVRIVRPQSQYYTLASNNSPLPVTVTNTLDYAVSIRLSVTTVNGLPGLKTRDIGTQTFEPHQQRTLKLPTSIARSGRIAIKAQLSTARGQSLAAPIQLSVHSSAFGVVGVVITIVAGAVLLLALLIRALRVLLRRRAGGTSPGSEDTGPDPTDLGAGTPDAAGAPG